MNPKQTAWIAPSWPCWIMGTHLGRVWPQQRRPVDEDSVDAKVQHRRLVGAVHAEFAVHSHNGPQRRLARVEADARPMFRCRQMLRLPLATTPPFRSVFVCTQTQGPPESLLNVPVQTTCVVPVEVHDRLPSTSSPACSLKRQPPSALPAGEATESGIAVSDAHAKTLGDLIDKGRSAFDRVSPSVHETRGVDEICLVSRASEADIEQSPILR